MTHGKRKFDVEAAMRILAETDRLIDSALTEDERKALGALRATIGREGAEEFYAATQTFQAAEDFDLIATADALESLARKVRAVVKVKETILYEKVLDVYYCVAT